MVAPGGERSHLLGTMHLGFDYEDMPPVVWERLAASRRVVLEADLAQMTPADMQMRAQLPKGQSLRAMIGEAAWTKLLAAVPGVPGEMLDELRPWAAASVVIQRAYPTVLPLDLAVLRHAESRELTLVFLETMEFQLELFERVMDAQALVEISDEAGEGRALLERAVVAYRAGDVEELTRVSLDPANFADRPEVADLFLYARNRAWMPKLAPLLARGGIFVAVGAAHLIGDQGVLKMLTDKGYRVTRVAP